MKKPFGLYDPSLVGINYKPRIEEARAEGRAAGLSDASTDTFRTMLALIDFQQCFTRPGMPLCVPGAVDDIRRIIAWILTHPEEITRVLITLDSHSALQVFTRWWWKHRDGYHPDDFTDILTDRVESGIWIPQVMPKWSRTYPRRLEESGQAPLKIWPQHGEVGSEGWQLDPALIEVIEWLCAARNIAPTYLFKGNVPESEYYGIFRPCILVPTHPDGGWNYPLLNWFPTFDRVIEAGEAEEFCVGESMKQQIAHYREVDPEVLKKIVFLRDCTSTVLPENRGRADELLDTMKHVGIQVSTTTELV